MSGLFRLYIWVFLCAAQAANASGTLSGSLRAFEEVSSVPSGVSLSLTSTQYFAAQQKYFREGAVAQSPSVSVGVQESVRYKKTRFSGGISLKNEYNASENWNYIDVYEFYGKTQLSANADIVVGRKLETWTEWESAWGQGVFQPRYTENKLEPQQAGLLGAFFNWNGENVRATVAALPLYLPDFGPMSSVADDKFVSANPWFRPPVDEFTFRNVVTDLRFKVNRPDSWSVINHAGGAAKIEFGKRDLMSRLSYAYKPLPQLLFGFPSRGGFNINADFFQIELAPRLRYHSVVAWDGVAKAGAWRLSMSAAYDRPIDDGGPQTWTSGQVSPAWIYSASASRPLEEEGPTAARLGFGFLKVIGGDAPDRGDFAGAVTLFERRFQYREGYLVEISKPFRGLFARPLVTSARFVYDRVQNGGVASLHSSLAFNANLSASLNFDMLGLLGQDAEVVDGFLSTYRANDRVALGMTYVF